MSMFDIHVSVKSCTFFSICPFVTRCCPVDVNSYILQNQRLNCLWWRPELVVCGRHQYVSIVCSRTNTLYVAANHNYCGSVCKSV